MWAASEEGRKTREAFLVYTTNPVEENDGDGCQIFGFAFGLVRPDMSVNDVMPPFWRAGHITKPSSLRSCARGGSGTSLPGLSTCPVGPCNNDDRLIAQL